jgi:hypothetical protein
MMERRDFLKIAFGAAAGAVALAAAAKATPLAPHTLLPEPSNDHDTVAEPALANQKDLDAAHIEQVRWHRHRHWGWRRHYWRRRRYWRRRHYGWHRRRWRRHYYW